MDASHSASRFSAALAAGPDWGPTVKACLDRLDPVAGANLGFLYLTEALAEDATSIVTLLRGVTGIRDWVGTVGTGICASGVTLFDQPAMAVMIAALPPDSWRLFAPLADGLGDFAARDGAWAAAHGPGLALVHADPRQPGIAPLLADLASASGGFLVGGLTGGRGAPIQFGGHPAEGPLAAGAVSGVLFAASVPVATGLTQGCRPIGPKRLVTAARDNVVIEIDGRPALAAFKEDIGPVLARDLRRVAGTIFAAFPVAGSDTADYTVRALLAIDPQRGWIAVGETVSDGQPILFARRDLPAARADLDRMLAGLKRRIQGPPRGAIYVSCTARGPHLFDSADDELGLIRAGLGDVPLVGFFANGEIFRDCVHTHSGVLTLFL